MDDIHMNNRNMHSYYLDKIQKNINQIKRSNNMSLLKNMNEGQYNLNSKKNTNYVDINESNPNYAKNGLANEYTYNQNINYKQNENINSSLNRGKYIVYNNGHIKDDINTNYDYNSYVNKYKKFPDKIASENSHYNYDTIRTEPNNISKDLRNVQYPYNNSKVVHDQNKGLIINSPCYSKINDCNKIYLANINENNHMFKNCHNGHMRMNASVLCPNHLKNNNIKQGYNKSELKKNNNMEMVYDGYYNSNDRAYMNGNIYNNNLDYKIHGDLININDNKTAQYVPGYFPHNEKMNKEYNYALRAGEHLNQNTHTGFYNNNMCNNVENINNISKNISSFETNKNNYFVQEPSYIENDLRQHFVENNYNRSLINITNNNCSKSTNIKNQNIYIPNKEHVQLNNSEINNINIDCLKKNNGANNVPVATNLYQPLDETGKCQNKLYPHSIYTSIPNNNNSSNTNLNEFVESTQIDGDKKENFIIKNNLDHNIKHSFTNNETMDNVLETNRYFLNSFQKEKEVENEKKILLSQNEEDNMSKISENENISCNFLPTKIINCISLNNNSKTKIQNNTSTENNVPLNAVNCVMDKDIAINEKEKEIIKCNNNEKNSEILNEMEVSDFDQIKSSDNKSEENTIECNIFNIMCNSVRKNSKTENCNNEKDVENKKEVNKFEEKNKISDISSIDNNSDENFHYENHIHKGYKSHHIVDNNMDIDEKMKLEKELESYFIKEGFLSPKDSNLDYNDFMSEKSSMYINGELQSDTSIYSENTKSFNTEYTRRVNCEAPSSSVDIFEDNKIKEVFDGLITNRSSTHSFSAQTDINRMKNDRNKNINNYLENEIDISNTDNTSKYSINEDMTYNKDGNSSIICSKNIEQEKIDSIEYFFSKNKNLLFIDLLKLNNDRKRNIEKKYVSFEDKLKDKLELLMHRDSEKERNIIDKIIYCLDPSYINNTVNDKKRWEEKLKYMQEKFLESILCVSYPNSMWNKNTFELYLKSLNFNSLLDDTFIKYEKDLNIDLFQKEEEIFSDAGNIGEGGFGVVTKMRFLSFPQYYAIKKISKDHIIKSQAAGQAYLEAKYHSVLSHVNVIKMYGCMQDDNYIYHVLEYCPKGSIYSISKNFKKRIIPEELAYKYFCNVVNGLYYLNQMGIFHRDIKMENVLVDHKDNAKLSDFGLSAMILGEKSHSSLCGTLVYFSPEIISGEGYDWRSDIWSLGILLYEMLVGDVPFDGTKTQIVQSIYSCNLNFPSFINPLAINLIKKALVVDVNKRIKLSEIASDPWMQEMWKLTFQKGLIESNDIINDDSYNFNFIHNIIKSECLIKKSLNASLNFHTDSCSNNKLESVLSNEKIEALDSLILETQQKIVEYLDLDEFYNNEETLSSFENLSTIKSEYLQSYSNEQVDHTEEIKSDEILEENIESSKLDSENDYNMTQKNIYDIPMENIQQPSNINSMNIDNNIKTDENINIENCDQMKHQLKVTSENDSVEYKATNSAGNLSINEVDDIYKNEFKDPQMNNTDMKNILSEEEKRSSCEYKYIRMNGMDISEMQFHEENSQCSDTNTSVMNSHLSNKNEIEKEIINENNEMNEDDKCVNANTNVDLKMNGNSYESILCNIMFKLRKLNEKKGNSNIMEEIDNLKLSLQNDENEGYKSISNTIKARLDLSKKKMSDYLERQCSIMSEHKNENELLDKSKTFENDNILSNESENLSMVENIEKGEVHNNSPIDKENQINSEVGKLYIPISVTKENNKEFENENNSFKINLKMKDTSTEKMTSQTDISESDDIEEFNRLMKRTKNMLNRKMISEKKTEDDLGNDTKHATTNFDNNKKIIDDNLTKFTKDHETNTKLEEACVVPDLGKKSISDKKKRKDCFDNNNKKDKMTSSKKVEKNLEKKHNGKYNKKNMIDYKKKYSHKESRIGSKLSINKKNVAIEEESCNDLFNLDKGSLYDEYIEKINKLYLNLKNKKLIYDNEKDKNTENSHILTKNIKGSLTNEIDNDSNKFSKEETERSSLDNIDRQNINEVKANKYDNNIVKEESLILSSNNGSSKDSDVLDKGMDNNNFNKKKVNFCKKSSISKKNKNIIQNLYDHKLNDAENSRKVELNNKCLAYDDKKESSFFKLKKDVINGNIKSLKTRLTPDFIEPKINTKKNNNSNSSAYRYSSEQINKKVSINSDNKKSMCISDNNTLDYSISDYSSDRSFYKKNKIMSKLNNSIEKKNIKSIKSVNKYEKDKGAINMNKLEQSEYDIINANNKYKMESSTENVSKFSKKKTNSLCVLNLNNKVTFMATENYSNLLNSSNCMNNNDIKGNRNSSNLKKIEMSNEIKEKTEEENTMKQIIYDEKKKSNFGKNVKEDLIYKKKSINKKDGPIQNHFNNKMNISKNEAIVNEETDNASIKERIDSPCVQKDEILKKYIKKIVLKKTSSNSTSLITKGKEVHIEEMMKKNIGMKKTSKETLKRSSSFQLNLKKNSYDDIQNRSVTKTCSMESALKKAASNNIGEKIKRNKKNNDDIVLRNKKTFSTTNEECERDEDNDCLSNNEVKKNGNSYQSNKHILFANNLKNSKIKEYLKSKIDQIKNKKEYNPSFSGIEKSKDNESNIVNSVNTKKSSSNINRVNKNSYQNNKIGTYLKKGKRSASETFLNNSINNCNNKQNNELKIKRTTSTSELYKTGKKSVQQANANNSKKNKIKYGFSRSTSEVVKSFNKTSPPNFSLLFDTDTISEKKNTPRANSINNPTPNNRNNDDEMSKKIKGTSSMIHNQYKEKNNEQMEKIRTRTYTNIYSHKKLDLSNVKSKIDTNIFKKSKSVLDQNSVKEIKESDECTTKIEEIDIPPKNNNKPEKAHSNILSYNKKIYSKQNSYNNTHINDKLKKHSSLNKNIGSRNNINLGSKGKQINQLEVDDSKNMNNGFLKQNDHTKKKNITNLINTKYDEDLQKKFLDLNNKQNGEIDTKYGKSKEDKEMSKTSIPRINDINMNANYRNSKTCEGNKNEKSNYTDIIVNCNSIDSCKNKEHNDNKTDEVKRENESINKSGVEQENIYDENETHNAKKKCITNFSFNNLNCFMASSEIEKEDISYEDNKTNNDIERDVVIRRDISKNRNYSCNGVFNNDKNINTSDDQKKTYSQKSASSTLRAYERYKNDVNRLIKGKMYIDVYTNKDKNNITKDSNNKKNCTNSAQRENEKHSKYTSSNNVFSPSKILLSCSSFKSFYTDDAIQKHENDVMNNKSKESIINTTNDMNKENIIENSDENNNDLIESFKKGTLLLKFKNLKKSASNIVLNNPLVKSFSMHNQRNILPKICSTSRNGTTESIFSTNENKTEKNKLHIINIEAQKNGGVLNRENLTFKSSNSRKSDIKKNNSILIENKEAISCNKALSSLLYNTYSSKSKADFSKCDEQVFNHGNIISILQNGQKQCIQGKTRSGSSVSSISLRSKVDLDKKKSFTNTAKIIDVIMKKQDSRNNDKISNNVGIINTKVVIE
ncbi:serine/threonine protein kinase, putative [Plasmodium vinckei vinckei]|uniref:Serine/threonine protein kinase, putative n=1 Tax=Plasmodium vinckei vinckei TaxID=54757 RepID=A0A449BVE9_PLAVN|nr:serine/threonine protein kinase, putative [Plasmodium vinckei vinckei]VEV57457.1 serine/threonine protein kinase, putative [Plasmodium vinckei vinckei]